MPQKDAILVDTGPIVAIVDSDESQHKACMKVLKTLPRRTKLLTASPVLTEASYLLSEVSLGQDRLFDLIDALQLSIVPVTNSHLARVRSLMTRYHDLPMDFADAVLVALAEESKIKTVFTLDRRGFQVYRPSHTKHLEILP
ncbi:MAG: hypothetical protein DKT66_00620 [Candidatus Melainabacteria bacterium]|nr:MAG: hypothetical protein DKT66_00620 [Candidatus Melainabacteria bacterium]